eukprot:jgi/Phyca11/46283/gw1.46.191.1
MITSPFMRPIFWSSIRTGDDQHTGEYMASALANVIKDVEDIIGKEAVVAVITDNAANMRNGCSAHTLNLLLQDIFGIEYMRDVLNKAVAVTKFVRKRPALLYYFKAKQRLKIGPRGRRRSLVLPIPTRWYSSSNCISSIVNNEEVLRDVFRNGSLLERYGNAAVKLNRVLGILADSTFWTRARAILRLVGPITKALGALESDGCCLSMIYHYFLLTTIQERIASRWNMLKSESVLAAFLLDPSKRIAAFEDLDLAKAIDASVSLAVRAGLPSDISVPEYRQALLRFVRAKESWTPEECRKIEVDTPLDWWLLNRSQFPMLYALAARVLSIPTSSASSERSWSVHSFIHNKRRNRLKPERVEKLAFVYSN